MENLGKILITCGLSLDILGAVILASATIISREEAYQRGRTVWMSSKKEENYKMPAIAGLIRDAKRARMGLGILIVGFVIQIIGVWKS